MKGSILSLSKKGDLGISKNYRALPLLAVTSKVSHTFFVNQIQLEFENILSNDQKIFRETRSTPSEILTNSQIIEGVRAK